ncbi:MAG: Xaa-Pro dipeptidase [Armatimonadetes bacterium]|jgi:Xaa-Pro aminopeptidase|nr:Xaa-Pro dipeptidase [Armatimonadota bacterium]
MSRIDNFRRRLSELAVPAALVTDPLNVGYLSGFTGSNGAVLVTAERAVFVTDGRYTTQAKRECPGFELAIAPSSGAFTDALAERVKDLAPESLAVESDHVTIARLKELEEKLPGLALRPLLDLASPLRRVKDAGEIAAIREACAITDRAFEYLLTLLRPGVTEREIAADLEHWMKRNGSEKPAFETIVVSGANSALPHGRPTDKPLEAGDFITFDFGARVRLYPSDLTRTVVLGAATDRHREVYQTVLDAQLAAIEAIRPGADGKAVDSVARDLIAARGFGANFSHGLGHGIGLHIHDHIAFSQRAEVTLEPGMVVTVEPGIYVEGWGGVRIEDDVLVTADGHEVLTHAPKQLIEVPV